MSLVDVFPRASHLRRCPLAQVHTEGFESCRGALEFGDNSSRGREIANYKLHVRDSFIGSGAIDAIVIGTKTLRDFYNYTFETVMSGIGQASYDGAHIHDLISKHITMRDFGSPVLILVVVFSAIYARLRRPPNLIRRRDWGSGTSATSLCRTSSRRA